MKLFQHGFDTKGMIPILYWRICHEVVQAGFDPTSLLFACAIHCAGRVFRSYGPVQHSPQELQQLVAPIALYPDALVAQVLAASTYPTEIVEADRWMQSHSNLKG